MKKTLLTLLLILFVNAYGFGQYINSVTVVPANPTTTDHVMVLVNSTFNSGSCDLSTQSMSQTGNHFDAYTLHCLGMLTVICTDEDTFHLGLLPAGSYTFRVGVDQGSGFPTCTPGFVPGPQDSVQFVVTLPTSVFDPVYGDHQFCLSPNPASGEVNLVIKKDMDIKNSVLQLFSMEGKKVMEKNIKGSHEIIQLPVAKGVYVYRLQTSQGFTSMQKLIVQ